MSKLKEKFSSSRIILLDQSASILIPHWPVAWTWCRWCTLELAGAYWRTYGLNISNNCSLWKGFKRTCAYRPSASRVREPVSSEIHRILYYGNSYPENSAKLWIRDHKSYQSQYSCTSGWENILVTMAVSSTQTHPWGSNRRPSSGSVTSTVRMNIS